MLTSSTHFHFARHFLSRFSFSKPTLLKITSAESHDTLFVVVMDTLVSVVLMSQNSSSGVTYSWIDKSASVTIDKTTII